MHHAQVFRVGGLGLGCPVFPAARETDLAAVPYGFTARFVAPGR